MVAFEIFSESLTDAIALVNRNKRKIKIHAIHAHKVRCPQEERLTWEKF